MRIKNLLYLVVALATGQFLFSCSSAEYYTFKPGNTEAYNTAKPKPAAPEVAPVTEVAPAVAETMVATTEETEMAAADEPVLEASTSTAPAPALAPRKEAKVANVPAAATEEVTLEKREMTVVEAEALAMAKEHLKNMTKAEKKELKKEVKEMMRQSGSRTSVVEIILAVLLPPLAVFLHDGIGTSFWINIILTLLFFIPGIIHALLVVTDTI
ncbi:YqaE/Pmp3 family membrane protein [Pontibacter mangrovi]|nr:YqaE/Pmp3 family membrane protein [Pontibacter mangrovi]